MAGRDRLSRFLYGYFFCCCNFKFYDSDGNRKERLPANQISEGIQRGPVFARSVKVLLQLKKTSALRLGCKLKVYGYIFLRMF